MKFLTENIVNSTLILEYGTIAAYYSLNNVKSILYNEIVKTSNTGSLQIIIDLGSVRSCNYICFGNVYHNSNFSLIVGAADNGVNWDTYILYHQPLTYTKKNDLHSFSSCNKRYWLISFYDWVGVVNYLGIVFLGTIYNLPKYESYDFNFKFNYHNIENQKPIIIKNKIQNKQRQYDNINIMGLNEAQALEFINLFYVNCNKNEYPFFILGDDGKYYYMKFIDNSLNYKIINKDYTSINFGLIEQL